MGTDINVDSHITVMALTKPRMERKPKLRFGNQQGFKKELFSLERWSPMYVEDGSLSQTPQDYVVTFR